MANLDRTVIGTQQIDKPGSIRSFSDTRKLRCQKCGGMAVPTPDGKGGIMHQCAQCHQIFLSGNM